MLFILALRYKRFRFHASGGNGNTMIDATQFSLFTRDGEMAGNVTITFMTDDVTGVLPEADQIYLQEHLQEACNERAEHFMCLAPLQIDDLTAGRPSDRVSVGMNLLAEGLRATVNIEIECHPDDQVELNVIAMGTAMEMLGHFLEDAEITANRDKFEVIAAMLAAGSGLN